MADDVDISNDRSECELDMSINSIRQRASNIEKGYPGECESCEEPSPRLVHGYCARCRDKYDL